MFGFLTQRIALLSLNKLSSGVMSGVNFLSKTCPNASRPSTLSIFGTQQVRWTTYGQEYQPSSRRRKRKFGYLARMRTRDGRKILKRRIMKGRTYLSA